MVKLNKIYTKNGDKGYTQLVGGASVPKSSQRVAAYGDIDEFNSALGVVIALLNEKSEFQKTATELVKIQNDLFDIGAILATDSAQAWPGMPEITEDHVKELEVKIDFYNKDLPELNSFVLPGGAQLNAFFHLARCICRRAERNICVLNSSDPVSPRILEYINRLSDLLFVLARWTSSVTSQPEVLWVPGKPAPTQK